jgi:hypothetical protein
MLPVSTLSRISATSVLSRPKGLKGFQFIFFPLIPNYVVSWTFESQQGVLASWESLFAALRGGRCSSAPEPSLIEQTASAPTSGALLIPKSAFIWTFAL